MQKKQVLFHFISLLSPLHLLYSSAPAASSLTAVELPKALSAVTIKHEASTATQLLRLQWPAFLWDRLENGGMTQRCKRARREPCLLGHWEEKPTGCISQDVSGREVAAPNSARWTTFSKRKGELTLSAKYQCTCVSKWEFWEKKIKSICLQLVYRCRRKPSPVEPDLCSASSLTTVAITFRHKPLKSKEKY